MHAICHKTLRQIGAEAAWAARHHTCQHVVSQVQESQRWTLATPLRQVALHTSRAGRTWRASLSSLHRPRHACVVCAGLHPSCRHTGWCVHGVLRSAASHAEKHCTLQGRGAAPSVRCCPRPIAACALWPGCWAGCLQSSMRLLTFARAAVAAVLRRARMLRQQHTWQRGCRQCHHGFTADMPAPTHPSAYCPPR